MEHGDRVAFSRGPAGDTAELRGDCPKSILGVLDAVSLARNMTRIALVNEILGEWTAKKAHEAMLVHRVTTGNPAAAESRGGHPS